MIYIKKEYAMAIAISNHAGPSYSGINMTPLIDVMLVLLVIFIITLPHETHAVKIGNPSPQPHAQPTPTPEVIDLQIDFDGTLLWNKAAVNRAKMQGYISATALKSPQPEVHITVDRFASYEIVAQTLADLQSRGMKTIGFVNDTF
jgi:biopolymer transport protein ExbD